MAGQTRRWFVLLGLCALCLWLGDARPCFSRAVAPAPVVVLAAGPDKHVIKAGETVNLLALRYGVSGAAILKANPGLDPTKLQLGKTIIIPSSSGAAPAATTDEPAQSGKPVELRPEKAPQATQPLAPAPQGHDLVDSPRATTVEPLPVPKPMVQEAAPARPAPARPAPAKPTQVATPAPEQSKPPRVEEIFPPSATPAAADAGDSLTRLRPLVASLWLLGLLGVAVLVLAVAFRGLLANLGAGLSLIALRHPRVGALVRVGDAIGVVTSRGLFFLELRTAEGERVLVPNAVLLRRPLAVLPAREEA